MTDLLEAEKAHLAQLLEAIQRCVYFLNAAIQKSPFPLHGSELEHRKKEENLFETLSAFNERFSKLQDTLAAAMRHAHLLSGENANNFLKILAFYEKQEVIVSIEAWQLLRTARNLAAHDYEIDYFQIAEHFNTLNELTTIRLVPKLQLGNAYRQALLEEVFCRSAPVIRDAKASCTAFPSRRLGKRQERLPKESPLIGIIICRSKNKTVVEYALRNSVRPLGVVTYAVVPQLPDDYKAKLQSLEWTAKRRRLWDKIHDNNKGANYA